MAEHRGDEYIQKLGLEKGHNAVKTIASPFIEVSGDEEIVNVALRNAAAYVKEKNKDWGEAVRPKIPAKTKSVIPEGRDAGRTLICIGCPNGCLVTVDKNPDGSLSITGNTCKKGEEYARNEVTAPKRTVTSIVRVSGGKNPVVSVKTKEEIPKEKIAACMEEINRTALKAPVSLGQIVIADVAGTGVDIVATGDA